MVSILQRMRKLRTLLAIRTGPGAAVLPPNVSRLHLQFAQRNNEGHMGARKFWRLCLPRLKYHNPSVSMTIDRTLETAAQPSLTVTSDGTINTIDLRNKTDSQILAELVNITGATELQPAREDLELAATLAEQRERSERDSRRMAEVNRARKREEEILRQARGEIA